MTQLPVQCDLDDTHEKTNYSWSSQLNKIQRVRAASESSSNLGVFERIKMVLELGTLGTWDCGTLGFIYLFMSHLESFGKSSVI